MKKNRLLVIVMLFALLLAGSVPVQAQTDVSTTKLFSQVKTAYGEKFPLSKENEINTKMKNLFGQYSTILGVSAKYFSEYKAAKKSDSKEEYVCFICKATSDDNVSVIKAAMKEYVSNEKKGNENYFSKKGKKLMKNAKVGSKGMYVYMFILDTKKNKKAIKAFKKAIA